MAADQNFVFWILAAHTALPAEGMVGVGVGGKEIPARTQPSPACSVWALRQRKQEAMWQSGYNEESAHWFLFHKPIQAIGPSCPEHWTLPMIEGLGGRLPGMPCYHHPGGRRGLVQAFCPLRALCCSASVDAGLPCSALGHSVCAVLCSWFWLGAKGLVALPCLGPSECWSWTGSWWEGCVCSSLWEAQILASGFLSAWNTKIGGISMGCNLLHLEIKVSIFESDLLFQVEKIQMEGTRLHLLILNEYNF